MEEEVETEPKPKVEEEVETEPKTEEGNEGYDITTPNVISFEERLEEAAIAFNTEGVELTPEQINLLTFIVMNYNSIDAAVKNHLEN